MPQITSFLAGMLFAAGLGIGGMTQPAKVIGFLDVAGDWDPSLAFVMLGAIVVHATAVRWILRRQAPLFAARFSVPTRTDVDAPLVVGAVIFGCGWGLVGYCPGPALVALGSGVLAAAVFVPAMALGMWLQRVLSVQFGLSSVRPLHTSDISGLRTTAMQDLARQRRGSRV
jgi:uncharacterized membrane protein YedE/YeeE